MNHTKDVTFSFVFFFEFCSSSSFDVDAPPLIRCIEFLSLPLLIDDVGLLNPLAAARGGEDFMLAGCFCLSLPFSLPPQLRSCRKMLWFYWRWGRWLLNWKADHECSLFACYCVLLVYRLCLVEGNYHRHVEGDSCLLAYCHASHSAPLFFASLIKTQASLRADYACLL